MGRSAAVAGRSGPRVFCAFSDCLAEQPDSCDRLGLLLGVEEEGRGAQMALLGVLQMSADESGEGEIKRDVLRHALPSGRRRCRVPPALRTGGRNDHPRLRTQLLWPKVEP